MKDQNKKTELTYSEIEYVYTCWKQGHSETYKNFMDYMKIAISGKEITGSIYS